MASQARRIIVHGRVQGVGFRYFVQSAAGRLGLVGNVRNRRDGTVEIAVEGDEAVIEEFLKEVRKGPPFSRVDRLDVTEAPADGKYTSFRIEGW